MKIKLNGNKVKEEVFLQLQHDFDLKDDWKNLSLTKIAMWSFFMKIHDVKEQV